MSTKNDALHSAREAAKQAHGSCLTIEARTRTLERVIGAAWDRGQQVGGVEGLRLKHVEEYIRERQAAGVSPRTLQNETAHIRRGIDACGRAKAATEKCLTNASLAIGKSCRDGTRPPATMEQVKAAYEHAAGRDAGIAATVRLQETLGLRRMEAIQSAGSLATWAARLEKGEAVHVIFGTKNGRERDVHAVDPKAALAAVREAQGVAATRGGKLMLGSLRQAETRHRHEWNRHIGPSSGIDSHQLRCAFAKARFDAYLVAGCTRKEALAKVSMDLGHGDGRGRYVERVYLALA